jgi:hypothetical protein
MSGLVVLRTPYIDGAPTGGAVDPIVVESQATGEPVATGWPNYDVHQERTQRRIPVVLFEPTT